MESLFFRSLQSTIVGSSCSSKVEACRWQKDVQMKKKSHLQKFFFENRWLLLGLAWLIGLALGYFGFVLYANQNNEAWATGDIFYRTLQLVAMNSGAVDGKINWMLNVARFILPLLTAYTFLQGLLHIFKEQIQRQRLRRFKDHIVICGIGRKGARIAKELLALGYNVVIIDNEHNRESEEVFRSQGAIILDGDATNRDILTSARVQYARNLVCLLGSDRDNLQIAHQAFQLTHNRQVGKLTCTIHLASIDLLKLIRISELSKNPHVPFELETFNAYERTARLLLQEGAKWDEFISSEGIPGSLLVIGLGKLGEQLVVQAGYQWHLLNRSDQLVVTMIDSDAEEKKRNLLRNYPQLEKVFELNPIQVELTSIGLLQNIIAPPKSGEVIQAYICLDDPVLSLQVCLNLLQIPGYINKPIWVHLSKESGLTSILEKPLPGLGMASQIRTFDIFDHACSADLMLGGMHEILARDLHEIYRADNHSASASKTWEQLPEALKDANRQQASRIFQLLKEGGHRIYPIQDWDAHKKVFTGTEMEMMACLEHALWRQAKEADGWTYAEERDNDKQTHPDLVPWEELPEVEREKNLKVIRQLPALLARIGFEIGPI